MTATISSDKQHDTFYTADNSTLAIANPELELERDGIKILRCRLNFQLDYEAYCHVVRDGLFNLKEVIASLNKEEFNPELKISLQTELKPSLLPQLAKIGSSKAAISDYLSSFEPAAEAIADSILYTENWYCLTIKQENISYHTLWHHANPTTIDRAASSSQEALQGIMSFLQEAMASYQASPEVRIANQKMERELSQILQPLTEFDSAPISSRSISQAMLDFFIEDNWDYYWWEPEETLQLQCQAKNGRLTCYARAIDDRQQFVFYTLCPLSAPESQRRAIAELIIKINYGMAIGNFELDFADGEIRYKTSLDVEGDRLSQALIKQAVYLNVLTMDRYLPIISAVIEGTISVDEAIAQAES